MELDREAEYTDSIQNMNDSTLHMEFCNLRMVIDLQIKCMPSKIALERLQVVVQEMTKRIIS